MPRSKLRMKIADVRAAIESRQQVAVQEYYSGGPRPARVLAANQTRRVFSGERSDMHGHTAKDGVLVQYRGEQPRVVAPTAVLGPYEEVTALLAERAEATQERATALAEEKGRAEYAVSILGGWVHPVIDRRTFRTTAYQVRMSVDAAHELATFEAQRRLGEGAL